MIKKIIPIIIVLALLAIPAFAQGGQRAISKQYRPGPGGSPINQSSRLEVMNQGEIFFDLNLINKTSVLYMGNSPVFTFSVRVVKPTRRDPGFRGQEYVLKGNTEQRVILDQSKGVVYLKIKKRNGNVKKLVISRVSVRNLPNRAKRFYLTDNVNLAINVNYNNGQLSSTVGFKGVPIFVLATGYEMIQGRRNMNVLQLQGNTTGRYYYDRTTQTLYYKSPKGKGTWTKVRNVRR